MCIRDSPGLDLVEMKESSLCCGSAGIYNIIREEMANELGAVSYTHLRAHETVLDLVCRLLLEKKKKKKKKHKTQKKETRNN